jgi:trypsin
MRRTSRTILHPHFSGVDYDYGLLLWDDDIITIDPVRLHFDRRDDLVDKYSTALGWGSIFEGGPQSDVLLGVAGLRIWGNDECERVLNTPITDRMVCAGGQQGRDACQGDSGNALFLDMTTRLVGLTSFGQGCARPGIPGVYARISQAESFIREHVNLPY